MGIEGAVSSEATVEGISLGDLTSYLLLAIGARQKTEMAQGVGLPRVSLEAIESTLPAGCWQALKACTSINHPWKSSHNPEGSFIDYTLSYFAPYATYGYDDTGQGGYSLTELGWNVFDDFMAAYETVQNLPHAEAIVNDALVGVLSPVPGTMGGVALV